MSVKMRQARETQCSLSQNLNFAVSPMIFLIPQISKYDLFTLCSIWHAYHKFNFLMSYYYLISKGLCQHRHWQTSYVRIMFFLEINLLPKQINISCYGPNLNPKGPYKKGKKCFFFFSDQPPRYYICIQIDNKFLFL